jgi:hypothetical protein
LFLGGLREYYIQKWLKNSKKNSLVLGGLNYLTNKIAKQIVPTFGHHKDSNSTNSLDPDRDSINLVARVMPSTIVFFLFDEKSDPLSVLTKTGY